MPTLGHKTQGITADLLYPIVWEAISALEADGEGGRGRFWFPFWLSYSVLNIILQVLSQTVADAFSYFGDPSIAIS